MTANRRFEELVKRGAAKYAITLKWELAPARDAVVLEFSRPGTVAHALVLWDVTDKCCLSKPQGSVMTAADVVQRLRERLERRPRTR